MNPSFSLPWPKTVVRQARSMTLMFLGILLGIASALGAPDPVWKNLSSKRGDLPAPPGGSTQQTGAVVGDFDGDGDNDFILSFRQKPPALVWYRRTATGLGPVRHREGLPHHRGRRRGARH